MPIRVCALIAAFTLVSQAGAEPGITRLAYDPVSNLIHVADAKVSDDGGVVVVKTDSISGSGGLWWKRADGWVGHSFPSGARPTGISADGSTTSVWISITETGIFTEAGGLELFTNTSGDYNRARGISSDGVVVVGTGDNVTAVRWIGGQQETIGIEMFSTALSTNHDGSVIYGTTVAFSPATYYLWRLENGSNYEVLENSPTINTGRSVYDCNRTGSIAVGYADSASDVPRPFIWHGVSSTLLAVDHGAYSAHIPFSLSETGELVVGSTNLPEDGGGTALIWINNDTLMPLSDFLVAEGIDLTGWILNRATDITPDGKYIVGGGQFNGVNSGFIIERDIGNNCTADLTGDGNLNFFDVSAFLSAFAANEAAADFTGDGLFNFFDVSAFLAAFAAGCP